MKNLNKNEEEYINHLEKIISDVQASEAHEKLIKNLTSLKKRILTCGGGEVTTPICGTGPGDAAIY